MGKGRDKRKKHEDPEKATRRSERQQAKLSRGTKTKSDVGEGGVALYGEEDIQQTVRRQRKYLERQKTVEEKDVAPPSPRTNCVFVQHPQRANELLLFGGEFWDGAATTAFNDLLVFQPSKNVWKQIIAPGAPSPRSSAQGFVYKQYLYVHGGEFVSQSQSQFLHFRDLWKFDTALMTWDEIKPKNSGPSSRSGHRAALWKRSAVVFGGFYDNSLESRYYDDLWILKDLDGAADWQPVLFPPHAEAPHKRSGHAVGVYMDTFFVYGGYSTEKPSRLQKAVATVHHDLWSTQLGVPSPQWTKIRLQGIPPSIRSGVGCCVKDKKMFLFGGVVDLDAPGGKTMSSFFNDLFVFNMETQKFFPLPLSKAQRHIEGANPTPQQSRRDRNITSNLADEIAELQQNTSVDDDEDDDDDALLAGGEAPAEKLEEAKTSVVTHGSQRLPCCRMNAMLCVVGRDLFLFGGQFESGKKEISISDAFSLNLNRMDTYNVFHEQNLTALAWQGEGESEPSGSWEDGSTVVSDDALLLALQREDGDDDEDDDDEQKPPTPPAASKGEDEDEDEDENEDDEEPPEASDIPQQLDFNASEIPIDVEARHRVKGKTGMKMHKEQLREQLGSASSVPTPSSNEPLEGFWNRTRGFWVASATEGLGEVISTCAAPLKRIEREAKHYCRLRYDEAKLLLQQLDLVEMQQKQEAEWIREQLAKRRAQREQEDDDEEAPQAVPVHPTHDSAGTS